ncbi:FCD domain-containing protein [Flavobacteriaceae bacterium]|nr:FCD domain-containing protein [Flavobacteriaceae bacterium]
MKISLTGTASKDDFKNEIFAKIRDLVNTHNFGFGDKLPSERLMSEMFNINRNQIREAIRKLEFYGVLKSHAKSGTVLNIGKIGLNGVVNEIISLSTPSFIELVETRITLEQKTVCLAAARRTAGDLEEIQTALAAFEEKLYRGENHLEEDLLIHLAIAKASKNTTLLNLMLLITPPILANYDRKLVCNGDDIASEIQKHRNIYQAIKNQNEKAALSAINTHFITLTKYIKS